MLVGEMLPVMYEDIPFPKVEYGGNMVSWNMRGQHYHNAYELCLMLEGDREIVINDKAYELNKNELLVIKPHTIHYSEKFRAEKITRYLAMFPTEMFDMCFDEKEKEDILKIVKTCIISLNPEQLNLIKLLMQQAERYKCMNTIISGKISLYYYAVITEAVRTFMPYAREVIETENVLRTEIINAIEYMHKNVRDCDMTTSEVAKYVHMSVSRFGEVFREVTGLSFVKYMNKFRFQKAKEQILKSDLSFSVIAEDFGFSSVAHMTRVFKEQVGVSPTVFRNLHRNK